MKRIALFICFMIMASYCLYAQSNSSATIKAKSETVKIIVNGLISNESMPFSDQRSDTIKVPININPLDFSLYTDTDSIKVRIPENSNFTLNIEKAGMKPLVIIIQNGIETNEITFDTIEKNSDLKFIYESGMNNPYLERLKKEYPIDSIAAKGKTDLEKVRSISSWVHKLWKHDGYNAPEKNDALYILEEVKKGQQFRCVEYGIVTTACLNAIGLPSRTLALKTKDVETTPSGAGHVVMEVFLNDFNKWVMVDPQWDAIFCLNDIPLNAVELQKAITEKKDIQILSDDKELNPNQYIAWIYPYLYYFSHKFDNRENIPKEDKIKINGKSDIMLVPIGAKNPTIFQRKFPIDYCIYTHSVLDFYSKPY